MAPLFIFNQKGVKMHIESMMRFAFNADKQRKLEAQITNPLPLLSVAYFAPDFQEKVFPKHGYDKILSTDPDAYKVIPCYTLAINSLVDFPDTEQELEDMLRAMMCSSEESISIYRVLCGKAFDIQEAVNAQGGQAGVGQNNVSLDDGLDGIYQFIVTVPVFVPDDRGLYTGVKPNTDNAVIFYNYLKENNICSKHELDSVFPKRVRYLAEQKAVVKPVATAKSFRP